MGTPARTDSDHLSADDASLKTPSRQSSVRSSSSVRRLSADDAALAPTILSARFQSEHPELSDVDLSAKPPSVATDSSRSRSDRGPRQNRHKAPSKGKSQDTGASSSGLTPVERARSLVLPTTELPATEVPREREWDSEKENDGSGETDTHPSTSDYHENLDLHVLQDGEYWPFLDETCKLASNTAYVFICG